MNIETYATVIVYFYIGIFFLLIPVGIVSLWKRIRRKTAKCWWLIPYSMLYLLFAIFGTFTAYIAYDDLSDPNYRTYEGWELHDFVLNDIKRFILWLLIGVLLYFLFGRKKCAKSTRMVCIALLTFLAFMLIVILTLSFVHH